MRIAAGLYEERRKGANESNTDLLDEFGEELRLKGTRRLDCVWVKGHATEAHVDRQITCTLDKRC